MTSRSWRALASVVVGLLVIAGLAGCSGAAVRGARVSDSPSVAGSSTGSAASESGSGPSSDSPTYSPTALPSSSVAPPSTPQAAGVGAPSGAAVSCPDATVHVTDTGSLRAALTRARPGTVIDLADGTYSGQFEATGSGSESAPIWLCGGRGAVIDGGRLKSGYAFHLAGASYWRLVGFSIMHGQKGVVVDGGTRDVLQDLSVSQIGDEGIHLRSGTTYTVVRANTVYGTGMLKRKFGEGIYIGSAASNWCKYGKCGPDESNFNTVIDNHISHTTAESVDVKEGTRNDRLVGNTFDGADGLTGADSWVDIKGLDWLIADNVGTHSPQDGFQVHEIVDGWGAGNVFRANVANVDGPGYGFHLTPVQNNVVDCDNKAVDAGQGLTNTTCVS